MNKSDLELKLLAGMPIYIDGLGELKCLKLKEIIEMNESKYNQYLSSLLFDKSQIEELENEKITNFELFTSLNYTDLSFREIVSESLTLFFGEEAYYVEDYGIFYFGELSEERILVEDKYEEMRHILRVSNNISQEEEEDYKAGNERAKKFMEKLKKKKKEAAKYKKQEINLHSLISGLAWKSNNLSIKEIFDLTVYQLYDGYFRVENIDNYNNVIRGIYAGTINGKEINLSKINWAKIIDLNKK